MGCTLAALTAIGVFHNSRQAPAAGGGAALEGFAAADCAPWDGAATSIYLSDATDSGRIPPPPPYLQLIIYQPAARLVDHRVEFGRMEDGSGIAVRCQAGGGCATSNRGSVEFGAAGEDGALLGSYTIDFSGDTVAGTFRARWVQRAAICG